MRTSENNAIARLQSKAFGDAIAYKDAESVVPEVFNAAVDHLILQVGYYNMVTCPYAVYANGMRARARVQYTGTLQYFRNTRNSSEISGRLSEFFGVFDTLNISQLVGM